MSSSQPTEQPGERSGRSTPRVALWAALFAVACAPSMRVNVVDAVATKSPRAELAAVTLGIVDLADARARDAKSAGLMTGREAAKLDGDFACANEESRYAKGAVSHQVTEALVAYLGAAGTFRATKVGAAGTDYYLTGTLRRLYGAQQTTALTDAGSGGADVFSAILGLASLASEAKAQIDIEIGDLAIHDVSGAVVGHVPDVRYVFEGILPANSCLRVFDHVSVHLRLASNTLLAQTSDALVAVVHESTNTALGRPDHKVTP